MRRPWLLLVFQASSLRRCRSGGRGVPSDQATIEPIDACSKMMCADMLSSILGEAEKETAAGRTRRRQSDRNGDWAYSAASRKPSSNSSAGSPSTTWSSPTDVLALRRLVLVDFGDGAFRQPFGQAGRIGSEQRRRVDEVALLEVLDERGARVLHPRPRQALACRRRILRAPGAIGRRGSLPCPYWRGSRPLRSHRLRRAPPTPDLLIPSRQESASMSTPRAAMRRVSGSKANLPSASKEGGGVPRHAAAEPMIATRRRNPPARSVRRRAENEQSEQRIVLDRCPRQRFMESIGADGRRSSRLPLAGHVGTRLRHDDRLVVGGVRRLAFLLGLGHAEVDRLHLALAIRDTSRCGPTSWACHIRVRPLGGSFTSP